MRSRCHAWVLAGVPARSSGGLNLQRLQPVPLSLEPCRRGLRVCMTSSTSFHAQTQRMAAEGCGLQALREHARNAGVLNVVCSVCIPLLRAVLWQP